MPARSGNWSARLGPRSDSPPPHTHRCPGSLATQYVKEHVTRSPEKPHHAHGPAWHRVVHITQSSREGGKEDIPEQREHFFFIIEMNK